MESDPPRLFDEAALRAIERWKFRPKIVDGTPVEQGRNRRLNSPCSSETRDRLNEREFSLLKVRLLIVTVAMVVFGAPLAADSITTKTFNKLTEAQEMMAQDNIEAAIEELELLLEEVQDQSLDRALTLQMLGYAEMSAERFEVP